LAVLAIVALLRYNAQQKTREISSNPAANTAVWTFDDDDQQLLSQLSAINPAMRSTYENSLRSVNNYISDVKKSVQSNPDDEDAREQLMQAYEQKAAWYEMAMSRAGE
jgi:molecular chaperone DnaK (HSP70)